MPRPKSLTPAERDEQYAINRNSYSAHFLPSYQRVGVAPRFIVQFPVVLPFHLPFQNGSCFTHALPEGNAFTIHFATITSTETLYAGIVGPDAPTVPCHRSRAEMTYVIEDGEAPEDTGDALTDIFDLLVAKVNAIITAYVVVSKDYRAYPVSKEMFEFGSLYRLIDVQQWLEFRSGLFISHRNVPFTAPELSEGENARVARLMWAISENKNPFILSEQLALSSRRNLANGFYREAVVDAQTSVETFLGTLLTTFLEMEGWDSSRILNHFEASSFVSRVKRDFHPRIGGNWSISDPTSVASEWHEQTYLLRNRIVHAGYAPSFDEASSSHAASVDFRRKVLHLIKAKGQTYTAILELITEPREDGANK